MVKKIGNSKIIILVSCIILVIVSLVVFNCMKIDSNEYKISYRIYDKRNGWSKWSKNGKTAGDGINAIQKIEIKIKNKNEKVRYELFENGKWVSETDKKVKIKDMYALKLSITPKLYKNYNIFYRTYNKKDNWLEWAYNNEISGNKEAPITKVQIKILKKEVSLEDYLEDYNLVENKSKGFNE